MSQKKVAIFGAGLLGRERIKAVRLLRERGLDVAVSGVYDPFLADAPKVLADLDVPAYADPAAIWANRPDLVVIATPHDIAPEITVTALGHGLNVLLEKPMGRGMAEAELIFAQQRHPGQLWVGFNYRFFEGLSAALADLRAGAFGKLISINMLLGHGHQPGAEQSWKLDPIKAGGGCLIDPGIHLLDLCHYFAGPAVRAVGGTTWSGYWNTGIEEECNLLLDADGVAINLQVSIVRWRSTMRIELHGTEGYAIITGKNRSFGPQTYVRGPRWGWRAGCTQADSERTIVETSGEAVFADELAGLLWPRPDAVAQPCDADGGMASMRLLADCRRVLGLSDGESKSRMDDRG
jgi:predicted dehydrogenase